MARLQERHVVLVVRERVPQISARGDLTGVILLVRILNGRYFFRPRASVPPIIPLLGDGIEQREGMGWGCVDCAVCDCLVDRSIEMFYIYVDNLFESSQPS